MFRRIAFAAGVIAAPASAAPVDVFFAGTPAEVGAKLANMCASGGSTVFEQDQFHITCGRTMDGLSGALTQALLGNSYSTTPQQKIRFGLIAGEGFTRVQATAWIETQMAFGQLRQEPMSGKRIEQQIRDGLVRQGGTLTPPALQIPPTGEVVPPPDSSD